MTKKPKARQFAEEWMIPAYWNQPLVASTETGDTDETIIFLASGAALTTWEQIEEALAHLFMYVTEIRDAKTGNLMSHLFGSVESSSSRLKMIRIALEFYFGHWWKHTSFRYSRMLDCIMAASHRRNEIAHGKIMRVTVHRGSGNMTESGTFLVAPQYSVQRNQPFWSRTTAPDDVLGSNASNYRYRAKEIIELTMKFRALHYGLEMETAAISKEDDTQLPRMVRTMLESGELKLRPGPI